MGTKLCYHDCATCNMLCKVDDMTPGALKYYTSVDMLKPLCCRELQLSPLQIAGAGISLVAAVALYGAMELWRYNSDIMQFPH